MTSPQFGQPITRDLEDAAVTPHDETTGDPRHRRVFYGAVTPAVVDGLEVGDLWVDLNIPVTKRCTSVGPVTFVSIEGGSAAHDILSATHTDTLAAVVSRGSILVGNVTPAWSELVLGGAATFLRSDATDLLYSAILDADVPASHSGTAHHLPQTFAIPTGGIDIGDAAAEGASGDATRADHQHQFAAPAASYPQDVAAAEVDGAATTPARADHVHAHGSGYLPDAHHNQSHSDSDHTAGFGIPTGAIDIGDAAAEGVATTHSRADHQHQNAAPAGGYPLDVAAAEDDGVATTPARADHVHAHGSGYLSNAHHNEAHAASHSDGGADEVAVQDLASDAATDGQVAKADGAGGVAFEDDEAGFTFIIDGGGAVITTGIKGWLVIPFACTITQQTTLADQTGSIVLDIWKDTFANYPPTVADTITASAKPTIAAGIKDQDSTLTGWTIALAKGDILYFNVDSVTTCERVSISLDVDKT